MLTQTHCKSNETSYAAVATCVCKQVADTLRHMIHTPIRIKDSFNTTTRTGSPDMKVITVRFYPPEKKQLTPLTQERKQVLKLRVYHAVTVT